MKSFILRGESDIQLMRNLIEQLPSKSTIPNFDEAMQLATVRDNTRLWQEDSKIIGFAFVDDFNNLRFEIDKTYHSLQVEREIIDWGAACIKKRNTQTGETHTLDSSFNPANTWQVAMLERHGFRRTGLRTLKYERSILKPIITHPFPTGFSLRSVEGEHEVDQLVSLHRAAFGTEYMTVERRLAMMRAPGYEQDLDLVAVAPGRELGAFCICGIDDQNGPKIGFTDPIGTHPDYQKLGLGKALITAGLHLLKSRGVTTVRLSTSSDNLPMQRLAESIGFACVSEKLWFFKDVTE